MAPSPGTRALLTLALTAGLTSVGSAQGGWRSWDVHLRDGRRVEANPLGAPDRGHISLSVGGFNGEEPAIPREQIDYIAAQTTVGPGREPVPGVVLPSVPEGRVCSDVVVYLDGKRTTGRISLTWIVWSEGIIRQRGKEIDLKDVAFLKFADPNPRHCPR